MTSAVVQTFSPVVVGPDEDSEDSTVLTVLQDRGEGLNQEELRLHVFICSRVLYGQYGRRTSSDGFSPVILAATKQLDPDPLSEALV